MEDRVNITRVMLPHRALPGCSYRAWALSAAVGVIILFAVSLFFPAPAMAQGESAQSVALNPVSGFVVTPYVSLETLYDSNIFASANQRESDTILRLSPGIGVAYTSTRSTFNFLYTFDSERYSRHSDLNSWQTRQAGLIGGTYAFTDRLTGGLSGNYLETYYPGELAPVTGVELTRTRATRISVRPTARYQFTPKTYANFFYDRTREHVAGGLTTFISTASAAVISQLTRRDQLTLQYQSSWFDFSTGTSPISRVFTFGWKRNLSREFSLFFVAGPRVTDGHTVADIYAAISRDTQRTSQMVSYTRSQLTLAGQTGVYDTYNWAAIFDFRPTPRWGIQLAPGYYRVSQGNQEAAAYRFGLAGRYWFARDWAVGLSYQYSRQRGVLGTANDALILRNVVALSLTWALPSGPGYPSLPSRRSYRISNPEGSSR